MKKRGFTLIELLVVVLIIGILSAIALPQYEKAVEKARMAEALQNIGSLQRAIDIYILENGYQESYFIAPLSEETVPLSIDLKTTLNCSEEDECMSKNFSYYAGCSPSDCTIVVQRHPGGIYSNPETYELWLQKSKSSNVWQKACYGSDANKYCSALWADGWSD